MSPCTLSVPDCLAGCPTLSRPRSYNDMPLELSEVLGVVNSVNKKVSSTVFAPDPDTGCSPIAVWFHRRVKDGRLMQQGGERGMSDRVRGPGRGGEGRGGQEKSGWVSGWVSER